MSEPRDESGLVEFIGGLMFQKLKRDAHKVHWRACTFQELIAGLKGEVSELEQALNASDFENLQLEGADVANFAAMIADNARLRANPEAAPLERCQAKNPDGGECRRERGHAGRHLCVDQKDGRYTVTWNDETQPAGSAESTARAETGPMQFGDDWPGVFIRGDNAAGFAMALEAVLASPSSDDIARSGARGLLDLLHGCNVALKRPATTLRPFSMCLPLEPLPSRGQGGHEVLLARAEAAERDLEAVRRRHADMTSRHGREYAQHAATELRNAELTERLRVFRLDWRDGDAGAGIAAGDELCNWLDRQAREGAPVAASEGDERLTAEGVARELRGSDATFGDVAIVARYGMRQRAAGIVALQTQLAAKEAECARLRTAAQAVHVFLDANERSALIEDGHERLVDRLDVLHGALREALAAAPATTNQEQVGSRLGDGEAELAKPIARLLNELREQLSAETEKTAAAQAEAERWAKRNRLLERRLRAAEQVTSGHADALLDTLEVR